MDFAKKLFNASAAYMGTIQMTQAATQTDEQSRERISALLQGSFAAMIGTIGTISVDDWIKYLTLFILSIQALRWIIGFFVGSVRWVGCNIFGFKIFSKKDESK